MNSSLSSGLFLPENAKVELTSKRNKLNCVKVDINNGELRVLECEDTDKLEDLANMVPSDAGCYFFLKKSPGKWDFISWIPEGKLKIRDRMLYSSSSSSIQAHFGSHMIVDNIHATALDDFVPQKAGSNNKDDVLSRLEKGRNEARRMEETARKEFSNSTSPNTSIGTQKKKIGGFHSVSIPFTNEAKEAMVKVNNEEYNFLVLNISDDTKTIKLTSANSISQSEIQKYIDQKLPCFYIYRSGFKKILLYCCPEGTPAKLRMVYSTCSSTLKDNINDLGLSITKKVESHYADEINHDFLVNEPRVVGSSYSTANQSQPSWVKKTNTNNTTPTYGSTIAGGGAAHPVYGLMNKQSPGTKKKIVMPPRGAYM